MSYASPEQRATFDKAPLHMSYAFKVLNADWAQYGKGSKWLGVDLSDLDEWHDEARIYRERVQGDESLVHLARLLSENSKELFNDDMRFWLVLDFYCAGPRIVLPLEIMSDHRNEQRAQSHLNQQFHTGSPENMELASSWLEDCAATHTECRSVIESPRWLPTRLLDVGTREDSVQRIIHSIELPNQPNIPRFAALSHCWGGFQHTSLLMGNIEKYAIGIEDADLSATIQDAVQVTRSLGLQYIWIDSLCIIQDSPGDWKRESATMMEVYGCSACTIVAAKSKSGAGGCFAERNPFRVRPCQISNPFSKDSGISFCIRSQYLSEIYKREVVDASWYERAWVFQERVLSPRLLIFGKSQMMWACQRLQASETWPCGKTSTNFIDTFDNFEVEKSRLLSLCSNSRKSSKNDTLWWTFILGYTRSKATKSSDRVIALQGIASRIQQSTGQHYVAGMWLNEALPSSLLWSAASPSQMRPPIYRAPSWSWASIDGPISIEQEFTSISVTYIEVLTTYSPSDLQDESIDMPRENLIVSGHLLLRELTGAGCLMIPRKPPTLFSTVEVDVEMDVSNEPVQKPAIFSVLINQSLQMYHYILESCYQTLQKILWCLKKYILPCLICVGTPVAFFFLLFWVVFWQYSLSYLWDYFLSPCYHHITQWFIDHFNSLRFSFGHQPVDEDMMGWQNRTHSMEGPPERDYNMHATCKLDTLHKAGTVQQVYCLPVIERVRGVEGLLLVPVAETPCHYRRVGVFQCASNSLGEMGGKRTVVLV